MATKTAEKKSSKKAAVIPAAIDPQTSLSSEVLNVLLHRAIVRLGEPARINEIVREVNEPSVTSALVRHVMETHPKDFVALDRRWDIAQRYLDRQRPQEKTLEEIASNYGGAMPAIEAAVEMAQIFGKSHEYFDELVMRLINGARFFTVGKGLSFGLRSWLLDIESEKEGDVLFYNFLSPAVIAPFAAAAAEADWETDPLGSASRIIAAANGAPVDNRILQFFAWKALADDFDPVALYDTLHAENDSLLPLPNNRWIFTDSLEPLRAIWTEQATQAAEFAPEEPVVNLSADIPPAPLKISHEDLNEVESYLRGQDESVSAADMLVNVLEIPASSTGFDADTITLTNELCAQPERYLWVGTDRFRAVHSLPPYLGQVPESLTFPTLPRFVTAEGEILDQLVKDSDLIESLLEDILHPVAQDVNDQEPNSVTIWPEDSSAISQSLRLVLKAHHKEIGTFPLAQIPLGFLPCDPNIVELIFKDESGGRFPVYVDYNVQLIYGLFDVYSEIAAESGAVFQLKKTEIPSEYLFVHSNETDPNVFVSSSRYEALLELKAAVEAEPTSTFDIVKRILEHYRKGVSFLTLLTEVNLVRRTPRRLAASILSSYSEFHKRANRWIYDSKH